MQQLEQSFLREVARLHHRAMGFAQKKDLMSFLIKRGVDPEGAKGYVYNQAIAEKLASISETIIDPIAECHDAISQALTEAGSPAAATYFKSIIERYRPADDTDTVQVGRPPLAKTIAAHWLKSQGRGNKVLRTGVYQVFRRYKPTQASAAADGPPDDIIVTELFYVDSDTLETVLVTSEGNLYWGTLHINHRATLYGLMQRPHEFTETNRPVSHRFYAVNIKQHGGRQRPLYSGLYIKTGDISELPLSGDCIFVQVPATENPQLHDRMMAFLDEPFSERSVIDDKVVMDYIAGFDEEADTSQRALRIGDFPFIQSLLDETPDRDPLFRPPARALGSKVVTDRAKGRPLTVFRHSNLPEDQEPTLL